MLLAGLPDETEDVIGDRGYDSSQSRSYTTPRCLVPMAIRIRLGKRDYLHLDQVEVIGEMPESYNTKAGDNTAEGAETVVPGEIRGRFRWEGQKSVPDRDAGIPS